MKRNVLLLKISWCFIKAAFSTKYRKYFLDGFYKNMKAIDKFHEEYKLKQATL